MPKMPPRPCTQARCNEMATSKGRCEQHQVEPWQSSKGKTPSDRGYGYVWQKTRKRALVRDSYLCQVCLKSNRLTLATEVDHILNKAQGGTDSLDNLQSICTDCHKIKTIEERKKCK